jgi:hypothetical protein
MPPSIPDAPTLLDAAIKYLEEELLPELDGYHRFKTRVTINVLVAIRRELILHSVQAAAEQARLSELLEHAGDLASLNNELTARIREGRIDLRDSKLIEHIQKALSEALSINNPKWL